MSMKMVVFVAAIPEQELIDEGRQPASLAISTMRINIPPVIICNIENKIEVEGAKGKLCEGIDRLRDQFMVKTEEKPTNDPKILSGRK